MPAESRQKALQTLSQLVGKIAAPPARKEVSHDTR